MISICILIFFKKKKKRENDIAYNNEMGENNILNKLIVMDNVSGLAGRSNYFANFLTAARKFNITCDYIFHTIYPTRSHWQMINSQTKIFNIFSGSLQTTSVAKILSSYCNRYTSLQRFMDQQTLL